LVVAVTTPNIRQFDAIAWDFEILDGGELPLNTNDAETPAFPLVSDMGFSATVVRSAPMMEVVVTMTIDPEAAHPNAIRVVAPPNFNFTGSTVDACLVAPTAEVLGCEKSDLVIGRESVILRCPQGGLSENSFEVKIIATCPDETPSAKEWFIEGLYNDEQVGWGEAEGFDIVQMPQSFVIYAGVPGISGHMIFHFQTLEKMGAKGFIEVTYPQDYQVQCEGDFFKKLTLPGWVTCKETPFQRKNTLTLNSTLNPGSYSFVMTGTALANAGDYALFDLQLLDKDQQVHDGAMNMPGQKISTDVMVAAIPFFWSNSQPGQGASITMGFDVLTKATVSVHGLLFNLPDGFEHRVERDSDFVVKSPFMKVSSNASGWLDWQSDKEALWVYLDTSGKSFELLEKGKYEFVFPTVVPARIPSFNAWTMSLCRVSRCATKDDPNVIVTLPVAGFRHGERHPNWGKKATASAHDIRSGILRLACLLSLISIFS